MGQSTKIPLASNRSRQGSLLTGRQEFPWTMLVSVLVSLLVVGLTSSTTVVVTFQEENYLVQGGCPSNEPEVQKWRKFCSVLHENSTLCVTERFGRQKLTVPRFSNICDALCHGPMSPEMTRCPGRNGEGGGPFAITHTYPEEFESKKLILNYEKTEYLARGGCPAKNPIAKRFYALCMSSFGERAVCESVAIPGKRLTYPVFTDVCSALCHTEKLSRNLRFCPGGARVVGQSPV